MRRSQKGSMTIFLALSATLFFSFCMVLMEGVRLYYLSVKAEQAIELSEFSVLSEYQQELFNHYGVFFVDLDYELGSEHTAVLEKRVENYLVQNASELETKEIEINHFRRATDGAGSTFFDQAVELISVRSGYKLLEDLQLYLEESESETLDIGELLEQTENQAEEFLNEQVDETGMPLFDISLPDISFPSIDALRKGVFGDLQGLSEKKIELSERLLKRELESGIGKEGDADVLQMQLFHSYLFEHFNFYGNQKDNVWKETLEYQLEYIISGEAEDVKNLENIMWRIFLLRVGGDYLFFHLDQEKMLQAEAEAVAIAGISGSLELVKVVREIILIAQAIEEGIQETRRVFLGEKVPLYIQGIFQEVELGYEEYLLLFLNATNKSEKTLRCMDLVEMEIKKQSGYENFRVDHCVDSFEVTWEYQFESLFTKIPLIRKENYEERITRKFYYEE